MAVDLDLRSLLLGDTDPATASGYADHPPRMGFFTDTSVCIGCKACEVACKEWNQIPMSIEGYTGNSYDNSVELDAARGRHGAFIEQKLPVDVTEGASLVEAAARVWKCTLCYDRLGVGAEPACAKACPTDSIQFGPVDELRERADTRLERLHDAGVADARLYGRDPADGVGGMLSTHPPTSERVRRLEALSGGPR